MSKIALVSGASRGIGREIARQLSRAGYFVALLARNAEELDELEMDIDSSGGKSKAYPVDITDSAAVDRIVAQVEADFGHIDLVVNNAGIGAFKSVENIAPDEWERLMNVNVKGSFNLTKAALPRMKARGAGHIVGVASDVSKRTFAGGALYCASKYAQDAFFKSLRQEVQELGVKVSVIYPGLVDTYFHEGNPGTPERAGYLRDIDIAHAVLYVVQAPPHVVIDEIMLHPMCQKW